MVLSGLIDPFHLTLGVISCGIVTWLSSDMLFENRSHTFSDRCRQAGRMIAYLVWLLGQIVIANLHIIRLAFSSREALQPQIVRFQTSLSSDFEKFLLANSITLTPGTVTIKILGDTFYIHAISDTAAEGLDGTMEAKIAHIFQTNEEGAVEPDRES